ncbi:SFRS7 [Mytilus coruscus]|uniref:SFRS7 n=1 Tax=Mytilus coruscus TaxID=42192 RepID=A0A6J8A9V7_MYTCO|nr:SFRS7 [Mytilus coruscus]
MNFNDGTGTRQHGCNIDDGTSQRGYYVDDDKSTKVYIGGLIDNIGNDKLQREFENFGQIVKVWIARSPFSRGYAFVDYADPNDAKRAIKEMNGKELFGGKILVQLSKQENKKWHPPCSETNYSDVKYEYELESASTLNKERKSRDRSSSRINGRVSSRYEQSGENPRSSRHPSERLYGRDTVSSRNRHRDSPRRRSRSRERHSSRQRYRSPDLSPRRRRRSPDRKSNGSSEYCNKRLTVDDSMIDHIRESVIKETLPQMYSLLFREILLLNDPIKMQSLLQVLPNPSNVQGNITNPINALGTKIPNPSNVLRTTSPGYHGNQTWGFNPSLQYSGATSSSNLHGNSVITSPHNLGQQYSMHNPGTLSTPSLSNVSSPNTQRKFSAFLQNTTPNSTFINWKDRQHVSGYSDGKCLTHNQTTYVQYPSKMNEKPYATSNGTTNNQLSKQQLHNSQDKHRQLQ